jgi:GNAT superfamily N-acetyltransferase
VDATTIGRTVERFWSLGAESIPLTGATAVRNRAAPDHPLGTFLCRLRTDDVEAVLAEAHHRTATAYGRVLVDPDTPAAAEAALALLDWRPEAQLALVLPRSTAVAPPADPPRPVDGDAEWKRVHELFRIDHREEDARAGLRPRPDAATASAVALRRSLGPAVTYFVAERAGEPVACIAAWPGDDGVGLVEDVFVHPAHRGGGIATDLLRHAVGHARVGGAGAVLIGAEIDDTPKHLYARFGFRPAAVLRSHVR